ncbi:MAG: PAS domain-containing sensor histidine kinase [Haloarculaceae archaeon]
MTDEDDPAGSADFFEHVVERVGVGVGVYDDSGEFTYVNRAYAEMLGTDRESLVGTPIWDINPEFETDQFDTYWSSFDVSDTRQTETIHERADGERIPVETYTTAVEIGGTRYNVGTIADITERREGERQLQRQNERLEEFASLVSHDLRNPLNVALGRADLIAEECDSEHTEYVIDALERMNDLIEDVLTLARQGQHLQETERVSLRKVAETAWQTTSVENATLSVADNMGVVESDQSRLCTIFENLFRNAVEHGGEDVTVSVDRLDDGFFVADDGPGIPPEEREKIFEYGYSTSDEGTGFGLAIVEEIADAHDWTVELTDSESGGARFEFHGVEFE